MPSPIEQHLADFLLMHPGKEYSDYRRRCLKLWREHYGEVITAKAEKIVKERYKPR